MSMAEETHDGIRPYNEESLRWVVGKLRRTYGNAMKMEKYFNDITSNTILSNMDKATTLWIILANLCINMYELIRVDRVKRVKFLDAISEYHKIFEDVV